MATRSLARKTPFVTPGVPPLKFRPASLHLSQLPAHVATQGRLSRSSPVACRCCTPPSLLPRVECHRLFIHLFMYLFLKALYAHQMRRQKRKKKSSCEQLKSDPFILQITDDFYELCGSQNKHVGQSVIVSSATLT